MKINNKPSTPFALYLILVVLTVSVYPKSVRLLMNTNYDFNANVASSAPVSNTASPQTDTTAPWSIVDFVFAEEEIPGTGDEQGNLDVEYTITGLSEEGRKKLKKRKKLVLPSKGKDDKTPVWISKGAFANLDLEEVEIPGNYTHIQFNAFAGSRIKKLVLHEGVVYANKHAFAGNKIEELILPSTFRYAAKGAFKNNKLKSLVLPKKVENIGEEAFMNNQISNLVFKGQIVHIHAKAFAGNKLCSVNIPLSLRNVKDRLTGIHESAFDENPGLPNPANPSENKVFLLTPKRDNPFKLLNKGNFIVDPKG
jgi:FMN-binding domain-containing protein (fragment)